jgi:hypothetical protein
MKLSPANLALLRQRPHRTQSYLSMFQPNTALACQVNDVYIARGARTIAYDSVTSGSYLSVGVGTTLLIGTAAGLSDVGRIRIRSITSTQFVVAENSHIDWKDNLYLIALRYREVWPVYPRIIVNPADALDVVFYKDYDIPHVSGTNGQNMVLGTFVCAGPHRAVFIEGSDAKLWYTSSGTYNLRNDSLAYDWYFQGGNPMSSSAANPGYVSYDTPGHYVTRLIVSGSGGSIDTTYRYISIYDRPENGVNVPILKWELDNFHGSRAEGGYIADITIRESIGNLFDGALVIIFSDDWYGSTKKSLGGNAENCSQIVFSGYILNGSIRYNYKEGSVKFSVGNISEIMKQAEGFAISVEDALEPYKWFELYKMDVRRAIYHFLKWHSTVLSLADFRFVGTDSAIQYFDSDRTSLFDAADNLIRTALLGELVSDRQGALWAEVSVAATPNATGTFAPIMILDNQDWMNDLAIEEQVLEPVSQLVYGGIRYEYPSGTNTTMVYNTTSADCYADRVNFYSDITSIAVGNSSADNRPIRAWLPFVVNINKGQVINSAKLKVVAVPANPYPKLFVRIGCEAADNPTAPTTGPSLLSRVLSAAHLSTELPGWTVGTEYIFDITAAVQETLNRDGWASGNTLAVMIVDNGTTSNSTNAFASFENTTYPEAKLEIHYSFIGSVSTPLIASAPGVTPGYRGKVEQAQKLALSSQSQLNQLVGDVYANKNAKYSPINIEFVGNYRNLDIAPQEAVTINIKKEDTNRGVAINALYFPSEISWSWNAEKGLFLPRATLSRITNGLPGETITL